MGTYMYRAPMGTDGPDMDAHGNQGYVSIYIHKINVGKATLVSS